MSTRFFGQPMKRLEDPRLLRGDALFIDDITVPRMVHAAFLRSPHAHARIVGLDLSAARRRKGVVAIFSAADLGDYWRPAPLVVPPPPIAGIVFNERTQLPLAKDLVRHVGEPVALVLAENRYLAEDALRDIAVTYEELPPVIDLEAALTDASARVHADLDSNIAAWVRQTKGDYAAAAASAHLRVHRRFIYDHGIASPIETRGIVAQWDDKARRLTVWDTTQAPIPIRNGLAAMLGLGESQVHVIAPSVGGGFGPKVMMFYPEERMIPWAAIRTGRPVKWIEDRAEHFVATSHERRQIHDAELALLSDGRIVGVKDEFLHDTGAYNPYGLTIPLNSQCTLLGPYVIPNYDSAFSAVFTNTTIVTPYRGAGRQHGVFVIERLLDIAARALGIDPCEIRRRNLIAADEFPYNNEIIYQDFAPLEYDSGDFAALIDKAAALIGYDQFRAVEQPRLRAAGKCVGLGLVCYVEGTGIGPYEGARVRVEPSGKACVTTGVGSQGQGQFTTLAQIAAEQLGIDPSQVDVITGDTDQFAWGAGTFASRGTVVAGSAVNEAALAVRKKILRLAAAEFECAEDDLEIADGKVAIKGVPGRATELGEIARRANPLRGAVAPDTEPGLEATRYFGPRGGATASGVHAAIVEVDPETLSVRIRTYVVVHDCGTIVNPRLVAGQIQGGVAQGIGNALLEEIKFDARGQLLTATLADYLLPTALDVPAVQIEHVITPSPLNALGVKGVGEAGAIPGGALMAQAIEDALGLPGRDAEILVVPIDPSRLWAMAYGKA
jgi:carbon-monoxide dehydrogenase large subunit